MLIQYVASDGKVFYSDEECILYEANLPAVKDHFAFFDEEGNKFSIEEILNPSNPMPVPVNNIMYYRFDTPEAVEYVKYCTLYSHISDDMVYEVGQYFWGEFFNLQSRFYSVEEIEGILKKMNKILAKVGGKIK